MPFNEGRRLSSANSGSHLDQDSASPAVNPGSAERTLGRVCSNSAFLLSDASDALAWVENHPSAEAAAYRIEFSPEARKHFAALDAHQQATLRDQMLVQLSHEPGVETRQRRRLRPNWLAAYRLRVGELRVYYDLIEVRDAVVLVKAIGIKVRERVVIGGEEIDLS